MAYGGGVIIAHFTAQSLALTEVAMAYVDDLRANGCAGRSRSLSLQLRRGR